MSEPAAKADIELAAEQAHLAASRAQLARMRERTASLDSAAAGDWVSREYLESTFALRMKQLADDPSIALFFGRVDYEIGEVFHIGRRHVSDPAGEPMVIDWRAPVSRPFYRASRTEPMGVTLRRRYGFQQGRLTAYEDEHLTAGEAEEHSAILEAEIERPRVGPMRDIVATIQPEQDVIVRSELSRTVCVQGAPGTGKTAVGLHRAAYLLYAYREQLSRRGVLVVGPNASFLRYIRDVLPALGEIDAKQTTIVELVADTLARLQPRNGIRGEDTAAVATLKGDARMAAVLERALWSHVATPTEGLVVPRGARRWRVATYEIEEVVAALRHRGVRYGAARAMLPQSLAHRILVKMELAGDCPGRPGPGRRRPQQAGQGLRQRDLAGRRPRPAGVASAVRTGLPGRCRRRDPRPRRAGRSALAAGRRARRAPPAGRSPTRCCWTRRPTWCERTPSLAHIVADEAQDLSPMMLRALARRSSTGSLTVLGDLAQATTPWATRSWAEALGHLGKPDAHIEELTRGFRVPGDVIEYAARLLPEIAPGLTPPTSVRRARGDLSVLAATGPLTDAVLAQVQAVVEREGSIGLIAPDALVPALGAVLTTAGLGFALLGAPESAENEFEQHLDLVPASLAKGLEFDHVVLAEPAAIVAAEPDRVTGLRRLYVCLTRAVTSLVVIHQAPLPDELAG